MLDSLNSLLAAAVLFLAAFGLGRPMARGLRCDRDSRLGVVTWSIALGLVAGGMALVLLGLCGGLYRPLIGVLTWCAAFWGLGEVMRGGLRPLSDDDRLDEPPDAALSLPHKWLYWGTLSMAAFAAAGALIAALALPTAGDALCYHLELPKAFLAEHALVHLPYSDNSTYPLLAEMWFLWGLALDGGVAAQLVHWGLGVLMALAAAQLAEPLLGRAWSHVVGALVLLIPAITNQMTSPLNDVAAAAFTTLALAAWRRAMFEDAPAARRWYVMAGLMLGAALGTKYLALLFAAAVAAATVGLMAGRRSERSAVLRGAVVAGLVAVAVGGVWYVRAAWHRGNPVYPFFDRHFSGEGPVSAGDKTPLAISAVEIATAPWLVTMSPEKFGGSGHQLGPLFLMALPGLLLARRLRGLGFLLTIAGAYGVLWYLLRQNVRFLLPIVPLLCIGVVWAAIELRRVPRVARLGACGLLSLAIAFGVLLPAYRARRAVKVAAGLESREEYLSRVEPTYAAAIWTGITQEAEARLLSQDYRGFYFPVAFTRESVFRRLTRYDAEVAGADVAGRLRREGFSHVLLAERRGEAGIDFDPTLARLVDGQMAAELSLPAHRRSWEVLIEYDFADADGARHYRLLKLR